MELYQLRSIAAIAELRHLTKAAEKMHVSQPALSAQVKALEDEFGLNLFERAPSGMVLTAAGKRLMVQVQQVLAAARALQDEVLALTGQMAGQARIGTVYTAEFVRLGEFMKLAVERYPLLEIELVQVVSGEALPAVLDGGLDGSFCYGEYKHPDIVQVALRKVTYRVAAPLEWTDVTSQDWKELAARPWLIGPPSSSLHHVAHRMFKRHGVQPNDVLAASFDAVNASLKVLEADRDALLCSQVAAGAGMALIREDVALERVAAGQLRLVDDISAVTTLRFIHRGDRREDPVIHALLHLLRVTWELNPRRLSPSRIR
jgi:DNA-binding transcriptional LysR family regulator